MNKFRCCRFHNLFVFMLILCAFSLASHYIADAAAITVDAIPCTTQESSKDCTSSLDEAQNASLHGGFMLNEVKGFNLLPALWVSIEHIEPYSLAWEPPALVRPPIFS